MKYTLSLCLFIVLANLYSQDSTVVPKLVLKDQLANFPNVRDFAYCPQSNEIIFSAQSYTVGNSTLVKLKLINDQWSDPEVLSFSGEFNDLEPFFSSDGMSLYFASNRPVDDENYAPKDVDIWVAKRETIDSEWQEISNLGSPINTSENEFYPIITHSGNIYLTIFKKGDVNKDDIYVSQYIDGKYAAPIPVEGGVNSEGYEFNAYVSPDESFMIFSGYNRKDGFGGGDLYISYKLENGEWSEAENLGKEINSDKLDYCPFVDIENQLLYFTSNKTTYNKPKEKMDIKELMKWFKAKDGLSRLYKVDFSKWLKKIKN